MKRTSYLSLIIVLISYLSVAQNNLNSYKYIIVPHQFDFQNSKDIYQLNALTKFLFEKEGFTAVFNDEKPDELLYNDCLGLTVNGIKQSTMFTTKITIELLNCRDEVVFKSAEGKSKEKNFEKGHQGAIRDAFKSFQQLNYKYDENQSIVKIKEPTRQTIVKKPEPKVLVKEEVKEVVKEQVKDVDKVKKVQKEVIEKPKEEVIVRKENPIKTTTIEGTYKNSDLNFSIVKKGENFTLVNKTVGVIANLYKTSKPKIYIVQWLSKEVPQLCVFDDYGVMSIDGKDEIIKYTKTD